MPNANANGSGVNAATSGVPSPPSDSSARRAAPPNVSTPVSAVAGWRSAQWAASWSLRNAARRSASFGVGGGFEHTGRVEVADLVLLPDRGAHGTKPSIDHRHSKASEPLVHKGKVDRDLLVILDPHRVVTRAHSPHPRSVRNPTDHTPATGQAGPTPPGEESSGVPVSSGVEAGAHPVGAVTASSPPPARRHAASGCRPRGSRRGRRRRRRSGCRPRSRSAGP